MEEDRMIELTARRVAELLAPTQKDVLTAREAADYMGVTLQYLYRLTSARLIPHSKPTGKVLYFRRVELEDWLTANRVPTLEETRTRAAARLAKKGGAR